MGVVDIDYEVYKCPHCEGYIILGKQFPYDDYGCSTTILHSDLLKPESGVELEEVIP